MSMNKNESIDDSEFDNAEIPTGRKLMKLNHYNVAGDQKETASISSRNDTKSEAISSIPSSHKHISHEVNWNLVNTLKKRVNASLKRSKSKQISRDLTPNMIEESFEGIQKLNNIKKQEATQNFEEILRNPEEAEYYLKHDILPKNFDEDYRVYLESMSSANQIAIFDTKQDLIKPRTIERKLRDRFIGELRNQRKIDNYEIKITPIVLQILQYDPRVQKEQYYDILHPQTSSRIASYLDLENDDGLSASLSSDEDKEDELQHFIINVEVDHYSYNENEQFMIVRTIEELHDNNEKFNVIQTLRIYQDTLNSGLLKLRCNHFKEENSEDKEFHIKDRISALFKGDQFREGSDPNRLYERGIPRYKLMKQIIVSDTGPLNKSLEKAKMGKYQQPTSILYYGKNMFFFQKDYKSSSSNFTLQQIDFQKIDSNQAFVKNIESCMIESNKKLIDNNQIYWALESQSKGKKLMHTDQELRNLDKFKMEFLQNQFVQIIDQDNLQDVLIYSLKSPDKCLSEGIQVPKTKFQCLYFNQFFVKREPLNSKNTQGSQETQTINFFSFYNSNYLSLELILDENLSNKCQKNFVYPYTKESDMKNKSKGTVARKDSTQHALIDFKKMFIKKQLIGNAIEVPENYGSNIKTQIKCLQNIRVQKYKPNIRRNKNGRLPYFDHQILAEEKIEEDNEETIFAEKDSMKEKDYINILFFIDEQAEVQVIHTQKQFKSLKEQQTGLEEMNDHYRLHIKSKIGQSIDEKQRKQVKVTYVKDMLTYEDSRFTGNGLIEYFVKADQAFVSKEQKQQNQNFLVAQTCQDQYLYIYKQNNLKSHIETDVNQDQEAYNQDFTFEIVKIRHHNYKKQKSKQNEQILRFVENYPPQKVSQVPQIRINSHYKGLISCWWGINSQNSQKLSQQIQIDLNEYLVQEENDHEVTKYKKLEFQEANIKKMVFETMDPPGLYFSTNICCQKLIKHLEDRHRSMNRLARIEFLMVPNTYFFHKNQYFVIIELKVFYKSNFQYLFTAENILVKFKMDKSCEEYNARKDDNDNILDLDTMVQFFICPEETRATTDSSMKNETIQFKLSDPKKLADYNLFKSKLFDFNEELMENFSEVQLKSNQKQTLIKFEKIVDSKIQPEIIPFLSYQKDILHLGAPKNTNPCIFNNFMMQALHFIQDISSQGQDQISISQSVITSPKKVDRMTILTDNQIQLWRSSDYYLSSNGSIVVHYKKSLAFDQMIDRVQIQEFKITFTQECKLKVYPVAKTESLYSSAHTQMKYENLKIIQYKIDEMKESEKKVPYDLIMKRNQYSNNPELRATEAIGHQNYDGDGNLILDTNSSSSNKKEDLVPFNQAYKLPFLQFGYHKEETDDARSFELVLHTRLHDECIFNKIFSKYEVYQVFEQTIKTMIKMKPVMIQDFEFLLLNNSKSYSFQTQINESFFQPQELFYGQSMLDINLNDPSMISDQTSKLIHLGQRIVENNQEDQLEQVQPLYKGSLFDNLTQNNPHTSLIKQKFQLGVDDYLLISQDFHFKSQLIRCLELNAENSYKIIIDCINKINTHQYCELIEKDLYHIMNKNEISEIYDFFAVSDFEELNEIKLGTNNLFCNFEQALIHEDLPTVWNEEGLSLQMQSFRDAQNQKEEITHRIAKMVPSGDSAENKTQVLHKYLNFQKVTLGQKIRNLYEFILENSEDPEKMDAIELTEVNLEEFEFTFDDLTLAQLMIQDDSNPNFYNIETVQKIVDSQFQKSSIFFRNLFLFYMITFIFPIVFQAMVQIEVVTNICYVISLFSLTFFFGIEICQMRQVGLQEYLNDFWNIVDCSQFVVFGYLTYVKIFEHSKSDSSEEQDQTTTKEVYLLVFSLVQAFLKGQSFARISEEYGFLVRMIGITVEELYPFLGVYTLYTMFFATAFMILEVELDVTEPDLLKSSYPTGPRLRRSSMESYPGIGKMYAYLLYAFRNSIGDLAIPNYDSWLLSRQEGQISLISGYFVVGLVWAIWLIQAIFMVIILLNYLIAVISQAYERVVNQRKIYGYVHKAEINLDYFQIKNQLKSQLKKIKFIVFVQPSNMNADGGENWLGFVHAIQKLFSNSDQRDLARYNKVFRVVEHIEEQSMKNNRIIRNMKQDVSSLKEDTQNIKLMLKQILQKQDRENNISSSLQE